MYSLYLCEEQRTGDGGWLAGWKVRHGDGLMGHVHLYVPLFFSICALNVVFLINRSISSVWFCLCSTISSSSMIETRSIGLAMALYMPNNWEAVLWMISYCGKGIGLWVVDLWFWRSLLMREGMRDASGRASL